MNTNFTVKKKSFLSLLLMIIICLVSLIVESRFINFVFIIMAFFLIYKHSENKSPVHLMFLIGFSVFIFFPALLNFYVLGTSLSLYYVTSIISLIFLFFSSGLIYKHNIIYRSGYKYVFLFFCLALIFSSFLKLNAMFFLSLIVMFFVLSLRKGYLFNNIFILIIFLITFFIYFIFLWGGNGRTVTFGMLITAFIYFALVHDIKLNKLLLVVLPVLGSIGLVSRKEFNFSYDIEEVLGDSAVGPYRLASTFIDDYKYKGFDFFGFLDQIIFTFFSFIPRDIWPSKPYGFGYEYVVKNMDQSLEDAGHSIASTLIGDHIYYLGWWGILSSLLMVYCVARFSRYLNNMKTFQGAVLVLISSNMMVFVWGGMTSFSARIIFPLIVITPIIFFIVYFKKATLFK